MRHLTHAAAVVFAAALFAGTTFLGAEAPQAPPAAAPAQAAPPAPPAGRGGAPGTESGWATFQQTCFKCHGNVATNAKTTAYAIRQMTPDRIVAGLKAPTHTEGQSLSDIQKQRVAEFMSGRPLGSVNNGEAKAMPNQCTANQPMRDPASGPGWNGWSPDLANTRFQPAAAARLAAADVPRLKLKWAFGIPNGMTNNAQPTVVGGRVFMATDTGYIYSLDAKTGCVYWSFQNGSIVRNSPMVGAVKGQGSAQWAVFFGDGHANVFALDAQTGRQLWKVHVDDHVVARITGSVRYHDGVRLRADLGLRGVHGRPSGLPVLHGARRRRGARREHRQADLEDLHGRRAEAVEEEPERRAVVRARGRRRLERADHRSGAWRALRRHR